ncbi:hypothetical protein [Paenibacillus tepidiphilus]|uniref:hypothetical protein n=1 Tax=Paenibacillus tepidiphilus TaxID=2608683 RepID=UPI0012388EC7|nr:hypothetical protein [Paenibacillus tepidiphilus]
MDDYRKAMEQQIIESYKQEEEMMILVFAQWCVNNDLDPQALYLQAYPDQESNAALGRALALTVSKEEAGDITNDTVLGVLSLFGNDDLAYVVTEAIAAKADNRGSRD